MQEYYRFDKFTMPVSEGTVQLDSAKAIGSRIDHRKYSAFCEYDGPMTLSKAIRINGVDFIIDGRTRSRANFDKGIVVVPSLVMHGDDPDLENLLSRIAPYFIHNIPLVRS